MSLPDARVLNRSYPANALYQSTGDHLAEACLKTLNLCPSPYNTLFFSSDNREVLQRAFRDRIRARLGFVIDRQNPEALCIIMRALYVNYGREPPCSDAEVVRKHVAMLNSIVLKMVLPQIASGVVAHVKYLRDASTLPAPLPNPVATTNAGTKNLPIFPGL